MHPHVGHLTAAAGAGACLAVCSAFAGSWAVIFQVANRYARQVADAKLRNRNPRYFFNREGGERHGERVRRFSDGEPIFDIIDSLEEERQRPPRQRWFSANRLR